MGVLIGSAVIPIALCLMWKKTNKWGAIAGALLGQWCGLVAWVVFAKVWAAMGLALGFCASCDVCCKSNMGVLASPLDLHCLTLTPVSFTSAFAAFHSCHCISLKYQFKI